MKEKQQFLLEKQNSEVFLRPRFSIDLEISKIALLVKFKNNVLNQSDFLINITDAHIFIDVAKKKEHFWSPQLHLEIIKISEKTSTLKGLFGPKPQVWTLFIFIHFVVAISFLGFLALFYTRWSLQNSLIFPTTMLIALPLVWLLLYFLGKVGKDTGKKQMKELHDFMITIIENS